MKGAAGRRGPSEGRFSRFRGMLLPKSVAEAEAIKHAKEIEQRKAEHHLREPDKPKVDKFLRPLRRSHFRTEATKVPMPHRKHQRRMANKRARVARRKNRVK